MMRCPGLRLKYLVLLALGGYRPCSHHHHHLGLLLDPTPSHRFSNNCSSSILIPRVLLAAPTVPILVVYQACLAPLSLLALLALQDPQDQQDHQGYQDHQGPKGLQVLQMAVTVSHLCLLPHHLLEGSLDLTCPKDQAQAQVQVQVQAQAPATYHSSNSSRGPHLHHHQGSFLLSWPANRCLPT